VSPLSPMNHQLNTAQGTNHLDQDYTDWLHDTDNHKLELSGEAAPSISELSPSPERSPINIPQRAAVPALNHDGFGAERSSPAEVAAMQPSLNPPTRSPDNAPVEAGGKAHVMSFMNYDDATPSPAR